MNSPATIDKAVREPSHADKAFVMGAATCFILVSLTGVAIWAVLNAILPVFVLPEHLQNATGNVSAELLEEHRAASDFVRYQNAALSVAIAAAALALVLAAGELLFRRSPVRAVWGGLLAALIAAGAGVGGVTLGAELMQSLEIENPLARTIAVQAAILGVMGLGVGLAISIPILRPRLFINGLVGGVLGGLLAALIFPMAVSLLHKVNTEGLLAEGIGLLVWILIAYGLIGVTIAGLGKEQRKSSVEAAPAKASG